WKYQENDAVRSVAVSCAGIKRKTSMQLSVFEDYTKTLQQQQLERTIDKIRDRYGFNALMHANSLIDGATGLKRSDLVGGHKG
ncbi:excinuclease ABC subunit A, partial [Listeria monocytogenes]